MFCGGEEEEVDVWLYWGDTDATETGDWSGAPEYAGKFGAGPVSHELFVLDYGETYFYNFYATNEFAGAFSPEAARIDTPGAPELGKVAHMLSPATASAAVTVDIVEKGAYPVLKFFWGYGDAESMVLAETVGEAGIAEPHVFEINGLAHGAKCWYAVELETPVGVDARTNSFDVFYSFTRSSGGTTSGSWNTPSQWTPNGVPNMAGDSATINNWGGWYTTHSVSLDTGGPTHIGNLYAGFGEGTRVYLGATAGSSLVMTNIGTYASIWAGVNLEGWFGIYVPLELAGETHVGCTQRQDSDLVLGGDITGPGPLRLTGGVLCFNVPGGIVRDFTTPFVATGGSVRKRGAGNFVFEGGSTSFSFKSQQYQQREPVADGGALVFSNHSHTNSTGASQFEGQTLFAGAGNKIIVTNESSFVFYYSMASFGCNYGGSDNAIIVNGRGSSLYLSSLNINGSRNTLRAEDGGYARLHHANVGCGGVSNSVWVGSATADVSVLDLVTGTRTLGVNGTDSRLVVAHGGEVVNGHVSVGGGTGGNRLVLGGGKMNCTTLTVGADNYIEPVLEALGGYAGYPVNVETAVVDGKILVRNPGRLTGTFPLVSAANPIANGEIEVEEWDGDVEEGKEEEGKEDEGKEEGVKEEGVKKGKLVWKVVYSDGNRKLSVKCSEPNTLIIIK